MKKMSVRNKLFVHIIGYTDQDRFCVISDSSSLWNMQNQSKSRQSNILENIAHDFCIPRNSYENFWIVSSNNRNMKDLPRDSNLLI